MLEFNSEHKRINGSLNKKEKIGIRNIIIGGLLVSSIFLFSGCAKTVDCDIADNHAHKYVSSEQFDKYVVSEKEHIGLGKWLRTDEFIIIDKEQEKLIDFENKHDLLKISDNQDKINEIVSSHEDYVEYRYKYTYMMQIPHTRKIGNTTSIYYTTIPTIGHSWTTNPNHSRLTGEERTIHHMYYGCKVIKNEEGKYEIVNSELVDNLNDLPEDYIYIKSDFVKKVNFDDRKIEIDYEDGPEEEKELVNEQIDYENQVEEEKPSGRSR